MKRTIALALAFALAGVGLAPVAAADHGGLFHVTCADPPGEPCNTLSLIEDVILGLGFCDEGETGVSHDDSGVCVPTPSPEECPDRTGVRDDNYGEACIDL